MNLPIERSGLLRFTNTPPPRAGVRLRASRSGPDFFGTSQHHPLSSAKWWLRWCLVAIDSCIPQHTLSIQQLDEGWQLSYAADSPSHLHVLECGCGTHRSDLLESLELHLATWRQLSWPFPTLPCLQRRHRGPLKRWSSSDELLPKLGFWSPALKLPQLETKKW